MNNTHPTFTRSAMRIESKIISGLMMLAMILSQAVLPYTAYATFDLSGYDGTPLGTANTTMKSTFDSVSATADKITTLNKQLSDARAGVLTLAMDQGILAQPDMLKQITDASKILPDDAILLATTMVDQGLASGALTMQIKNGATLGEASAEEMTEGVLRTYFGQGIYGVNVVDQVLWGQTYCYDQDLNPETPEVCIDGGVMRNWIGMGASSLLAYTGAITQESATNILTETYYTPPYTKNCHYESDNYVCDPEETIATVNNPDALGTSIRNAIIRNLAGKLVSAVGVLDETGSGGGTSYKKVFADEIKSITGVGDASALAASLDVTTFNTFTKVVKNAIHADILKQVKSLTDDTISPSAIETAIYGGLGDTREDLKSAALKSINVAISGGGVSLTQLTSLKDVGASDIQNMVKKALSESGLSGKVTPAQLDNILAGSLSDFRSFSGVADLAKMKGLIGGQIGKVLGVDPASIISKMGAGTVSSIKDTIKDVMVGNVVTQMGSLKGMLDPARIQGTIANSILSTTGVGNVATISGLMNGIPNFNSTLSDLRLQIPALSAIGDPKSALQSAATDAINAAIEGSGVSLTQLTSLKNIGIPDIENMVTSALGDSGLLGSVTPAQLNSILSGSISNFRSFSGVADISDLKGLIGGQIGSAFGVDPSGIISKMGGGTLSSIQGTIKDAMLGNVMSQMSALSGPLDPARIQSTIANSILSTTGIGDLTKISGLMTDIPNMSGTLLQLQANIPIMSISSQSVLSAISGGNVSLTQLTNLSSLGAGDIQNMINGALLDNGLLGSVSPAQFNSILSGSLDQFLSPPDGVLDIHGIADIADMKGLIGGQIGSVLGMDPSSIVSGMGDETLSGIQGAMTNLMQGNVASQLSSVTSGMNPAGIESLVSNSILHTTGLGNLSGITANIGGIPNLPLDLTGIQGNIQSIVDGQLGRVTELLDPANMQNLIAGKLTDLTGLSDINSILNKINPNIGTAFSTITQVGGQLESITGQFTGVFDSNMLGLNSLTSTFNGQFGDLTALAQQNLAGLTSQLSGIIGPVMSQITGPITSAIGSLSGTASSIIGSGSASLGDLTSLSGSLGGMTGQFTGVLSGSGGVTSLAGLGGVVGASGMVQRPMGGPIVMSIPCTSGDIPGSWLLRTVNYAGGPSDLIYIPGRSVLYPNFQVYRGGPMILGLYSVATPLSCWVGVGIFRFLVGAGPVISMVGTSI